MRGMSGKIVLVLAVALALSACSSDKSPKLLNIKSTTDGPDEFAIVPPKPLQAPESFAALPPPTPGGTNRTDVFPEADAIVALGGRPEALQAIPAADAGLVNVARRYGTDPVIRSRLAQEDLNFRRRKDGRILERLFNVNVYFRAYERQSLDQYAELERFRRIGVRTPAAPPAGY
ncbi:DUF3035 domain-containing protein [Pseudoruegeria sp. HB172150]|uniref:DUF3035 domain-containing protein n=1 Tax=Pseudoruegeria sp. HB172150 TaxID=2721164 RepID=UPI001555ACCD|nr:DUF3035 domain-containing protein [Pseudoruegeria sp. HB172150]